MHESPSGKKLAIIAYLTFIGMLIAIFKNKDDKNAFTTWHIKNMFGLIILLFIAVSLQDYAIGFYIYVTTVILWCYSIIMAATYKQKAIPVLSDKFQEWFTFLD